MSFDGRLLNGVTVLAAVVECGSFTRAAEVLGQSTSGVSRAMTRLEERLGVRLLERSTRALRLTREGERLYNEAVPHLAGLESVIDSTAGKAVAPSGGLRVGLNPIFSQHVLARRLSVFRERYPEIELTLLAVSDAGDLIAEGIDVAVRFGTPPTSGLSARRLLETRVVTVAAPTYIERAGRPATPAQLEEHDCIQFLNPQTGTPFSWIFQRGRETLPIASTGRLIMTSVETMIAASVAGVGIAQVLALSVEDQLRDGALIDLFPDWPGETFPLYVVRPSRRLAPARVEAFLRFCVEICEELSGRSS